MPSASSATACLLQRSHARGSVEGPKTALGLIPKHWLQRSHARGSVEGSRPPWPQIHRAQLQRSHARGSVEGWCCRGAVAGLSGASTEPRSWERGRARPCMKRLTPNWSFNGATLVGAWKGAEGEPGRGRRCRFNGATLVGAWKAGIHFQSQARLGAASTEPRSWERGRSQRATVRMTGIAASTEPRSWERGREE